MPTSKTENTKPKKKNYKWFVGIDVSKNELDFAVLRDTELLLHVEIPNKKNEITALCRYFKQEIDGFRMANTLFCMEQTGFYCGDLTKVLHTAKANFAIENALRIKRSSGLARGKDDRGDAIRIAAYASKYYPEIKLWKPRRPILEELKFLMALRMRLIETSRSLQHPIREQELFIAPSLQRKLKGLCENTIHAVDADRDRVEATIDQLIRSDARIERLVEIITSVKSIGRITAIFVILSTNEFLDINCPKKFACYAGVAPFKSESGIKRKKDQVSPIANRKMKSLLHICAMGAVYRHPELRAYYQRRTKVDGKARMSAINAVRYKLILRIFACVRQDRLYVSQYNRSGDASGELRDSASSGMQSAEVFQGQDFFGQQKELADSRKK